ncbi:MAG: CPBP family intramembrane metalloprotease [Saprospiraceae bacterium]|nr:MAG: CPBP family intramembrane metalloprotease [Saprospiraceae bacterium]
MHDPIPETEMPPENYPPPKLVVVSLAAVSFLCAILGSGIVYLACQAQGLDMQEAINSFGADSSLDERNFMRGVLLLNHMTTFLLPAMLVSWFFYRRQWPQNLCVAAAPPTTTLAWGLLFITVAFPLAQVAFDLNRWMVEHTPLLQSLVEMENAAESMMTGLLVMQSPAEVLFSILVMAAVPAIGEEMLFRGVLQQHLVRWMKRPAAAILLTALIFGLAHFEVQRFFAIFLLGVALGLLFYWTQNLWVPIAAHFLNNATQVVVAYFYQDELEKLNQGGGDSLPPLVAVASFALVLWVGKILRDRHQRSIDLHQNTTP